MMIVLQILLIAIAAICKAAVDTIVFHGGGKLPKIPFFDNRVQGRFLPLTKYPLDAKHLGNSLMIVSFILSGALGSAATEGHWIVGFVVLSIIFILIFNLFWNKIFN